MRILLVIIIVLVLFRLLFIFMEQKNLYHPQRNISQTPAAINLKFEDVYFKTGDGEILNGWFIPSQGARTTVLYCHGNAGNIYHRLHKVKFFHDMGVNFFIFDYRGYGKSTGSPGEKGLYLDAQGAFDYLLRRSDVNKNRIVVYGKSLGGAIAVDLCLKRKAAAIIMEGSFASVALRAKQMYPYLPMKLLVSQKYDALKKISGLGIPKLIAHGKKDNVISFDHGKRLYSAAKAPKEFLVFDGGHNDDTYITSPKFKEELSRFLRKYGLY